MSFLVKGQSTTTEAKKITSFQATTCEFGTPLPIAYGTCKLAPNLINYQDFTTKTITTTVKTGKKSSSTNIDYKYYVYTELALCEGPIDSVGAVWVGDKTYSSLAELDANSEGGALSLNKGDNSAPTTYMLQHHPDKAVGYKDMAYLYGKIYLGLNSASMPSYNVVVNGSLRNTGDNTDANPADIILDLIDKAGLSQYVDAASFENYRRYCRNMDLLMSTPPDAFGSQVKTQEVIKGILTLTNAYLVQSVDKIKIIPRDDRQIGDWQPNKTVVYDLTEDDFIKQNNGACVLFSKKDSTEISNRIGVTFVNRENDYEEETIFFDNTEDISQTGLRAAATVDGKWFYKKSRAIKCAEMLARINATENTKYTFKLDWAFERLEPGDLVTLTDSAIGLDKQVVMVETVTTDVMGRVTVTAIGRETGNYSAAAYDVHSVDYNYVDYNIIPTDTAAPLLITPPSELMTSNGLEVWCAMRGQDSTWGGCSVYLSDKDSNYTFDGQQVINSSYGKTVGDLTANGTSVTVHFDNYNTVELLSGSVYDAEKGNTLIWLDGECMSYTKATLVAPNTYELSGLVRGQYQTAQAAHSGGSDFAVLDSGLYVISLTKNYLGRTLYMRLPSFNVFKGNEQDLADAGNYTHLVGLYDIPNVSNVVAVASGFNITENLNAYQINVSWNVPEWADYQDAMVYYKNSTHPTWTYADSGYDKAVITQAEPGDVYYIAVCTRDAYGNYELPDSSAQTTCSVVVSATVPNTPTGFGAYMDYTPMAKWNIVTNAIISRYEVYYGAKNGNNTPIAITTSNETTLNLTVRTGNLYLYAVTAAGVYSSPAVAQYNFTQPAKPTLAKVTPTLTGLNIALDAIPTTCRKIRLVINSESRDIGQNILSVEYPPGIYAVKYCFVDYFGEGIYSEPVNATVEAKIDGALIKAESISYDMMSAAAKEAIGSASIDNINIATQGILGQGCALIMTDSGLALVASNGEKMSGMFVSEDIDVDGTTRSVMRLQGDYIHVNGLTEFDEDVIIKGQMVAGSISCDDGVSISAGAVTITENGMRVNEMNGYTTFDERGITFYDDNGSSYSQLHRTCIGIAKNNQRVIFSKEWENVPNVICIPLELQVNEKNHAQSDVFIVCKANNITKNGFDVECYTRLGEGSRNLIMISQNLATSSYVDYKLPVPISDKSLILNATIRGRENRSWSEKGGSRTTQARTKVQILVNGVVTAESGWAPLSGEASDSSSGSTAGSSWTTGKQTVDLSVYFPQGSNVVARSVYSYYYSSYGGTPSYISGVDTTLNYIEVTSGGSFISEGYVAFIAIDKNTDEYSIIDIT